MTKLLEQAIAKARALPDVEQDNAAEALMWAMEIQQSPAEGDEETWAAIDEGLAQARRGEFASDAEVAALWKRHGL